MSPKVSVTFSPLWCPRNSVGVWLALETLATRHTAVHYSSYKISKSRTFHFTKGEVSGYLHVMR